MRSPQVATLSSCNSSQTYCWSAGAGVEQHLEPAEEVLAQRCVAAQIRQQHLEALRHVEIDGRRDLAADCAPSPRSRRAAACPRRYRASRRCASTRLKLWLPPKVWFHGSQSTSTGGSSATNVKPDADHRLVRAQHALGVDDALGVAGRARGEQDFRDRVGPDLGVGGVDRVGRRGREQIGERASRRGLPADWPSTTISMPGGTAASIARANGLPSAANTRPGVRISMIDLSLPKSLDISE